MDAACRSSTTAPCMYQTDDPIAIARDLYGGMLCWSTVQDDETPAWASYEGPEQPMFRRGEEALADAHRAGVSSMGLWPAAKPA